MCYQFWKNNLEHHMIQIFNHLHNTNCILLMMATNKPIMAS